MKIATKTILACAAAAALVAPVHAALLVEQSLQWADGNNATNATSATFDLASGTKAGSLIVATAYVDNTSTTATNFNSVTFEGATASSVYSNGRLHAFLFQAPTAGSNTLSFTKSSNSGIGWIIYEISGANNATITATEGEDSITTSTANELVVSFAGRNGAAPTENTDLFTGADQTILGSAIRGTGTLTSACAIAPTIGSQDITWSTNDGRIAFAFEAASATGDAYDTWAATFAPADLSDRQADLDNDGLKNIQEFAFGTNPTVSNSAYIAYVPGGAVTSAGKPEAVNVAGSGVDFRAVFGRRKDWQSVGLTYTVQFSVTMQEGAWVDSTATPTVLTGDNDANPGDIEAVSVPYPFFIPVTGGYEKPTFFRVGVSMNP